MGLKTGKIKTSLRFKGQSRRFLISQLESLKPYRCCMGCDGGVVFAGRELSERSEQPDSQVQAAREGDDDGLDASATNAVITQTVLAVA